MTSKAAYPPDWNPPLRGTCENCGRTTKGVTTQWLAKCPDHWQALLRGETLSTDAMRNA
jgi:hypothetical protein